MVSWLLDSNVLSEAARPQPNGALLGALTRHTGELAIGAPVWHELRFGWLRMPHGRRRDAIERYLTDVVGSLPILAYDAAAARLHAEIRAESERIGMVLPFVDGQIAAIAMSRGLTLVTRNLKDFAGIRGLRISSWWTESDS
ncbi:type II toxin-antitoxin system VapC family toxin [Variovorax sp. dw_954]|uniref:type II toxin-antitoxin system VapC family toxin n=1 Tax=Variovorax sp. dw_954 TaxID=2720078 RepID=UPI001BD44ECF|nr:type II toxin-antitoxin system VapC family toxin [Variovorax sp. dw_954]